MLTFLGGSTDKVVSSAEHGDEGVDDDDAEDDDDGIVHSNVISF